MTITEAAACGTPAVATKIAGHTDAVVDGETGLLVSDPRELAPALHSVLADPGLYTRLRAGALAHAATFTWAATARGTFAALVQEAARRRRRAQRTAHLLGRSESGRQPSEAGGNAGVPRRGEAESGGAGASRPRSESGRQG
jgi:hypothetical protein